ncbi:hypothetical protein Lal_00018570 [Lupinus albus]|nr:hypothetical protein Lal_00018570 [Lupinus albus]
MLWQLINKQSLESVSLYLPGPVFSHVTISRVQSKKGLKILIYDKDDPTKVNNKCGSISYYYSTVLIRHSNAKISSSIRKSSLIS